MNCWYLIILLFLCGNCGSLSSGCGCNAPSGAGNAQRGGQRNDRGDCQRNSQRERGCDCDCDNERTQGYGSFGCDDGMMQSRAFTGFANNATCGCEEKQEDNCGCGAS